MHVVCLGRSRMVTHNGGRMDHSFLSAFILLLLVLMSFAFYNDLSRLFS